MATYRSKHIPMNSIAMVPTHGYINKTVFSPDSIEWLDFVAHKQGLQIQHALNQAGERKIAGLSVDGYCEDTNTIYQYQVSHATFPLTHRTDCYFVNMYITFFLLYFKGLFFPWMHFLLRK